ncbi:Uncharacterised protein [Nocardia otitidiscaviarum]|uniref:Uncharacterized protein n=2 Tax=Nocardia otitidiscaviarum TaxID=1823 RepID=A0A378YAV0_9NOCA|nr:Uncharacterised protein [Nocardia otitidiscaviarum]
MPRGLISLPAPAVPVDAAHSARIASLVLPPTAEAVVARWNPQGMALLEAARVGGEVAGSITLIGVDDANTALLRAELARFVPRLEVSEPVEEPVRPVGVALVLCDAAAPIGAHTLDVVRRLRAGGARIVFALGGIHAHDDWRGIRDRNRELLAAAFDDRSGVDIVPVSPQLAAAARTTADAALADRAGIALLHARLAAAAGAVTAADQAEGVLRRVLTDTRRRIDEQIEALRSAADVAALREERVELLAVGDGGRSIAMAALHNRMQLAKVDLVHEVGARIRALNIAARADVERLGRAEQRDYPRHLQRTVDELTAEIDAEIRHRLTDLTRLVELTVRAFASTEDDEAEPEPTMRVAQRVAAPPRVGPDPEPRHVGAEDRLMIVIGASAGFGLGRLIVSPFALMPALDYATVPLTLLLGAGVAAWLARARGQLADRAHLRQWIADALVNVKAHLEQRVAAVLVEAEDQITDQLVRLATENVVETDRRVGEIEDLLRAAAARRPGQLAACERDLRTLEFT